MFLEVDKKEIATDNRIRVQGRANMTLLPDFFLVDIYNLSNEDATVLVMGKLLYVYGEGKTLICCGEIEGIYEHEEGANDIITVSVSDGGQFWESKVAITIGSGAYVKDTIKTILKGVRFGDFLCNDFRMFRGQTFSGRIADVIHDMAVSINARAFVTGEVLNIIGKDNEENAIVINDDDVIAVPRQVDDVCILKTYVSGYSVGNIVNYQGVKYRVIVIAIDADNFEGEWSEEITLIENRAFWGKELGGGY